MSYQVMKKITLQVWLPMILVFFSSNGNATSGIYALYNFQPSIYLKNNAHSAPIADMQQLCHNYSY